MEYTITVFKQTIIMFILACTGVLCHKKNIISKEAGKCFSDFVLCIVTPALIFMSYQIELTDKVKTGLIMSFVLCILTHIILILFSSLAIRKGNGREYDIERFSIIYSNCGYMGIPLVEGVFGAEGVLYTTVYVTVFNTLLWTHGVICMKDKVSFRDMLPLFKSPALISIFLGLIFCILKIRVPEIIGKPLNYIGSMNTPLAMVVAGFNIAQTDIIKTIKKARVWLISFLRLIIAPAILIPIMSLIPCDEIVYMSVMLAACCPVAAVSVLFAVKYEKNAVYAAEIFAISTALSALTLPLMIIYIGFFR